MSTVYFVRSGPTGPIKIGYTRALRRRLSALNSGMPSLAVCVANLAGGRDLERALHLWLRPARISGEWFRAQPCLEAAERLSGCSERSAISEIGSWMVARKTARAALHEFTREKLKSAFSEAYETYGSPLAAELDLTSEGLRKIRIGKVMPSSATVFRMLEIEPHALDEIWAAASDFRGILFDLHKLSGDWVDACNEIRKPRAVRA